MPDSPSDSHTTPKRSEGVRLANGGDAPTRSLGACPSTRLIIRRALPKGVGSRFRHDVGSRYESFSRRNRLPTPFGAEHPPSLARRASVATWPFCKKMGSAATLLRALRRPVPAESVRNGLLPPPLESSGISGRRGQVGREPGRGMRSSAAEKNVPGMVDCLLPPIFAGWIIEGSAAKGQSFGTVRNQVGGFHVAAASSRRSGRPLHRATIHDPKSAMSQAASGNRKSA